MVAVKGKRTVYIGAKSRRAMITVPPTLASFFSRLRKAFPELQGMDRKKVQLFLDPTFNNRFPARGREPVVDESDYRCIMDGDAIVVVVGDQIIEPTPDLIAAFDGTTTYRHDYDGKQPKHRIRAPDQRDCIELSYPLGNAMPGNYGTTYRRDYIDRDRLPETDHVIPHD